MAQNPLPLTRTLYTTRELRTLLIQSLDDLVQKKLTPNEARARAWLAKEILDTLRLEIIASRTGLANYEPVELIKTNVIPGTATKDDNGNS